MYLNIPFPCNNELYVLNMIVFYNSIIIIKTYVLGFYYSYVRLSFHFSENKNLENCRAILRSVYVMRHGSLEQKKNPVEPGGEILASTGLAALGCGCAKPPFCRILKGICSGKEQKNIKISIKWIQTSGLCPYGE